METGKLKLIALTGAVAIVLLVLSSLMYIIIAGRNISATAPIIIGFAAPTVTTLFAFTGLQNSVTTLKNEVAEKLSTRTIPRIEEVNSSDNEHNN